MSGNEKIVLNAAELMTQSESMKTLKDEYDAMFTKVTSILNEMNDGWSENLSNNFVGKISTAQKGFAKIVEMLECGQNVAKEAATSFEDVNAVMARQISGAFSGLFENIDLGSLSGVIGTGISLDLVKEAWTKAGGWESYKDALSYITDGGIYQSLSKWEKEIFGTSHLSEADSILDLGKNLIDGKIFNSENIGALSNLIGLDKIGEFFGVSGPYAGVIVEGAQKIFGDGENIDTIQDYVIDYCESMDEMKEAFKEGNIIEGTIGTVFYSLENSTRVIGDVITDKIGDVIDFTGIDDALPWSDIKDGLESATGVDFDIVIPAVTDGISQGYSDMVDAVVEGWGHIEDGLQYVGGAVASGVGDLFEDASSAIAGLFGF